MKKEVLGGILCLSLAVVCCAGMILAKKISQDEVANENLSNNLVKPKTEDIKLPIPQNNIVKKELLTDIPSTQISLSVLEEIRTLPDNIYNEIRQILDNGNTIFYLKQTPNKVIIIKDNSEDNRHGIEFMELLTNGKSNNFGFGKSILHDEMSELDEWIFGEDEISKFPLKHTKFTPDGLIEYTETWNYSDNEPIKYEIKNGSDKIISIKKETQESDTIIRIEHLLYNEEGDTQISISITYEGPDIKRFTYYNANNPDEGGSVFSEFKNGVKTKEIIYSSDLKPEKTYTAFYKEGLISEILTN